MPSGQRCKRAGAMDRPVLAVLAAAKSSALSSNFSKGALPLPQMAHAAHLSKGALPLPQMAHAAHRVFRRCKQGLLAPRTAYSVAANRGFLRCAPLRPCGKHSWGTAKGQAQLQDKPS
eukprot:365961-Chlamydomonas_euryale.AAC.8